MDKLNVAVHMDRNLVTVFEYNTFAADTGREVKDGEDDWPVTNVTWHEAKAYAEWVSKLRGVKARLPYEWELCVAERAERIDLKTFDGWPHKSIATAKLSGSTFNDVTGVVYQWCEDGVNDCKVYRGGSWDNSPRYARVARRYWLTPVCRLDALGLRLAYD